MCPAAKHAVTIHAGIVELIRGVADGLLVSCLGCFVRGVPSGLKFSRKADPVRIRHRNGPSVFATAAGGEHEFRRLRQGNRSIVDNIPPWVNTAAPGKPIEASSRCVYGGLLGAWINSLNREDDIGARKQNAAHHLRNIT